MPCAGAIRSGRHRFGFPVHSLLTSFEVLEEIAALGCGDGVSEYAEWKRRMRDAFGHCVDTAAHQSISYSASHLLRGPLHRRPLPLSFPDVPQHITHPPPCSPHSHTHRAAAVPVLGVMAGDAVGQGSVLEGGGAGGGGRG